MADIARRGLLVAPLWGGLVMTGLGRDAVAQNTGAQDKLAWDFTFPDIDGGKLDLASLRGRVLLVVNTASFCGFTYQYEALQKLSKARLGQGLTVIGVPSRDFEQESATNEQVKAFCETTFGIDFPLTAIQKVRGDQAHPFYRWVRASKGWEPRWNFGKVLVGRDGRVVAAFGSSDEPMGFRVNSAIEAALAARA
jgi:glutathione peroxidase